LLLIELQDTGGSVLTLAGRLHSGWFRNESGCGQHEDLPIAVSLFTIR